MAHKFFADKSDWRRGCVVNRLNKVLTERVLEVLKYGQFVEARSYYSYSIHLYSYRSQFIEILVDDYSDNVLWIADATERDLEKYTAEVDVQMLLQ
jgi:hypothetical protein